MMKQTKNNNLSIYDIKILNATDDILSDMPIELGFVCRAMVAASMPHSKVNKNQYNRKTKKFTLSMIGNEEAGGVPYGTYPRLILSWIASEVVKNNSREIVLGSSLSNFMKNLGLMVTGGRWGTVTRFKDQLKKLFSAHISFSYEDTKEGKWINTNMNIADKTQIFWNPHHPEQIDLFKSKVLLGQSFFEEIKNAPIPVDIRAINALKNSSLALDIYFWLTYRLGYLKKTTYISFENLQLQFGSGYHDTPQGKYEFKRKFLHQLKKVTTIYSQAKLTINDSHILLHPSVSHIKKSYPQK